MATTAFVDTVTLSAAAWFNHADTVTYSYLTSPAGTNTITATGPASMTAYAAGQKFSFLPANDNTGATTINITPSGGAALGAKNIFQAGSACIGGEIQAGIPCTIQYDGTQFNMVGPYNGGEILAAIRYGGVTLTNAVTGTGNMVLSASPTLSGTVGGALTWSGAQTLTAAAPQLTLGVNATTLGSIKLFGNTSGNITIQPAAAAGTNVTITFPATSVTLNDANALTNTTLASNVVTSSLTTVGALASGSTATGFGALVGTQLATSSGSTSCLTATATTIYAVGNTLGSYLVYASVTGSGTAYLAHAWVDSDGAGVLGISDVTNGANLSLTVSGSNIQATQTSGSTANVVWSVLRVR